MITVTPELFKAIITGRKRQVSLILDVKRQSPEYERQWGQDPTGPNKQREIQFWSGPWHGPSIDQTVKVEHIAGNLVEIGDGQRQVQAVLTQTGVVRLGDSRTFENITKSCREDHSEAELASDPWLYVMTLDADVDPSLCTTRILIAALAACPAYLRPPRLHHQHKPVLIEALRQALYASRHATRVRQALEAAYLPVEPAPPPQPAYRFAYDRDRVLLVPNRIPARRRAGTATLA